MRHDNFIVIPLKTDISLAMPQPLFPSSQALPENKCPDCLFMNLEGMLVQFEKQGIFNLKTKSSATNQIKLSLTLNFNEQEEPLPVGCLKFGLKGGELKLRLENGTFSLASPGLNGAFELSVPQERHNHEGSDDQSCVTISLGERKPGVKASLGTQKTAEKVKQPQFPVSQVSDRGSLENPTWVFLGEKDNSILKGLLKHTLLGTLTVTAKPCRVEATFCVLPQDIYITDIAGVLPHTISKKKRLVIERAIARRLLKRKLNPYLSRHELRYD